MAFANDFLVKNGLVVSTTATILSSTNALNTTSGALIVSGGVGIGQDLRVGGVVYSPNVVGLITTATNLAGGLTGSIPFQTNSGVTDFIKIGTTNYALVSNGTTSTWQAIVNSLTAGTDTAVSSTSGAITIWNTSTLQSITQRGATTNQAISITNATASTSTTSGALIVSGGLGVAKDSFFGGTISIQTNQPFNSNPLIITSSGGNGNIYNQGGVLTLTGGSPYDNQTSSPIPSVLLNNSGSLKLYGGNTGITLFSTGDTSVAINNTTTSISTNTGALTVVGGLGVGGYVYASRLHDDGNRVVTRVTPSGSTYIGVESVVSAGTATSFTIKNLGVTDLTGSTYLGISTSTGSVSLTNLGVTNLSGSTYLGISASTGSVTLTNLGVQTLTAGTDTAVSSSTGTVTVWNTSTLQSITQRGATTNQIISITNTTSAISSTTGALQVVGGIGVQGDIFVGGTITAQQLTIEYTTITSVSTVIDDITTIKNTTNSSNTQSGALQVYGGVGIGGNLYVGGTINGTIVGSITGVASTATNIANGTAGQVPYQTAPGATSFFGPGTAGNLLVSNGTSAPTYQNTLTLAGTTAATSTNTGALQVAGGVGVGGSIYLGNALYGNSSTFTIGVTPDVSQGKAIYIAAGDAPGSVTDAGSVTIRGGEGASSSQAGSVSLIAGSVTVGGAGDVNLTAGNNLLGSGGNINLQPGTGLSNAGQVIINRTTAASSTTTGALRVYGGVGVGGSLYASNLYDSGNRVVTRVLPNGSTYIGIDTITSVGTATTFTVRNLGVTNLSGTTYLGISTSTGSVSLTNLGVTNLSGSTYLGISTSTGSVSLTNLGVTNLSGSTYIGISTSTGSVTVTNLGVQTLTAGTDTVVTSSTGTVTVYNNSTLQTVTNRGATTNQAISITSATVSTSTNSGALVVTGGVGIGGNLYVGGTINGTIVGSITGVATTATNLAGGTTGSIPYQVGAGRTDFIGIGASNTVLFSNGTTATWVSTASILGAVTVPIATPTVLGTVFGYTTGNGNTAIGCCSGNITQTGSDNFAAGCCTLRSNTTGSNNFAAGYSALRSNTIGSNNFALGYYALYGNTTGSNNVAIGLCALAGNVSGKDNIAIGSCYVLQSNTIGCQNIALGLCALYSNTSGNNNFAVGLFALKANTFGSNNIGLGYGVLANNTNGCNNVGIGYCSLNWNLTGISNVAIGRSAAYCNISGCYNFAGGACALYSNTTGNNNIAIGWCALYNDTASNNIALGSNSLQNNTLGTQNIALGSSALYSNTTGNNNISIGLCAGCSITTGSYNVIIGSNNGSTVATSSCNVIISDGVGNARICASNTGSVLIPSSLAAVSTVNAALQVVGGIGVGAGIQAGDSFHIQNSGATCLRIWNTGANNTTAGQVIFKKSLLYATINNGLDIGAVVVNDDNDSAQGSIRIHKAASNTDIGLYPSGNSTTSTAALLVRNNGITHSANSISISDSTQSINTQSGALTTVGGVGIGGALYVGGDIATANGQLSINARETTDGSLRSQVTISSTGTYTIAPVSGIEFSAQYQGGAGAGLGGISVGKLNTTSGDYSSYLSLHTRNNGSSVTERLRIDNTGSVIIYSANPTGSTNSGALQVTGGAGIGGGLFVGGTVTATLHVGNLTGVATTATNLAGGATYSLPYQNNTGTTAFIPIGASGYVLQSNGSGSAPSWAAVGALSAGNATTATNLAGGKTGSIPYQVSTGTTDFIGIGVSGTILQSNGTTATWITTASLFAGVQTAAATPTALGTVFGYTTGNGNTAIGCCSGNITQTGANNFSAGCLTLNSNTTGSNNFAVGCGALKSNTIGSSNFSAGDQALFCNTTGSSNVAIGCNALICNTIGCNNIAIGKYALSGCTVTGYSNIGLGSNALQNITSGCYNTAFGASTLVNNTTGSSNYAAGYGALFCNTTGSNNIAVGFCALCSNTFGNNNFAQGYKALGSNTTGCQNIAIGYCALQTNTIGTDNVALGYGSLKTNTIGSNNIGIGCAALCNNTTGVCNTAIGYNAGCSITTGSYNVIIGSNSGSGIATSRCNVIISDGAGNARICATNTGSVLIPSTNLATSTQTGALQVVGGVGIGSDLYVGGTSYFGRNLTNYVSITAGGAGTSPSISFTTDAGGGYAVPASQSHLFYNGGYLSAAITGPGSGVQNYIKLTAAASGSSPILQTMAGLDTTVDLNVTTAGAGKVVVTNTVTSVSTNTGALTVAGGVGIGGALYVGGNETITGVLAVQNATNATTTNSGAVQVLGGVGIGGALYVGGNETITGQLTINSTQANTGTAASNALYVTGGAYIDKSLVVVQEALFRGPVTFSGTATYILSTNTFYTDNIIELHTPPSGVYGNWNTDDGKDIGLRFHYYTAGTDTNAALVLDNSSKYLDWYSSGAEATNGDFSTATYGIFRTGNIKLMTGTPSTSTSTGDLTVIGGVGIGGNLWVGGTINASVTGVSTTATNLAGGTAGAIPYQTAPGNTGFISIGTTGTLLQSNGTIATWVTTSTLTVASAVTATNLASGTAGAILYQTAPGVTGFIGTGTTGYVLTMGATTATWQATTVATTVADITTTATYYPVFTDRTTGIFSTATITSSKLTWNPGTGILTAVDVNTTSDIRQKTNIAEIADPLALLDQIKGWAFDYKESGLGSYGVVAQELEEILPHLVGEHETGFKTVRYLPLIAILIEAVKDLAQEVKTLKKSNK
jgi:hypothetical protein